jgi:hypothetical protein
MTQPLLVLDSPFSSAFGLAATHYWMLPIRWLLRGRYRSDLAIRDIHAPVSSFTRQRRHRPGLARRLFSRQWAKTFLCVAGGGIVLDSGCGACAVDR